MTGERNVIQQTLEACGAGAEMSKKAGTWYRSTDEVIQAVNLQKSQYGPSYYVNAGWSLRSLGDVKFPKDHQWHVSIRLESLAAERADEVVELMDLKSGIPEGERSQRLQELFASELRPVLDRTPSIAGLLALWRGRPPKGAGVRRAADPILRP